MNKNECLQLVVGARLTSVQFVMNYLILGFDNRGALTTMVWPEVVTGPVVLKHGVVGYRDALCELILDAVATVEIDDAETITFGLASQKQIRIPLGSYVERGERAIFTAPGHVLSVW